MGRCVGWMLAWQGKMNFIDELQVQPTGTYLSPANFTLHPSTPRDARIWGGDGGSTQPSHLSPGQGLKNSPHSAVTTVLFLSGMYCNKTLNRKKGVSSRLLEVHLYIYTLYLLHVPYLIFASASNFLSHTYPLIIITPPISLFPLSLSTHAKKSNPPA